MRIVQRFFLVSLIVFGSVLGLSAEEKPQAALLQEFRALDLKETDSTQLETILAKYRQRLAKAEAEVNVFKAQVTQALVPEKPNLDEIRGLVRKSLEAEAEIRMVQIERQIEIRQLLGDDKWKKINKFLRRYRELVKENPKAAEKIADKALARNQTILHDLLQ